MTLQRWIGALGSSLTAGCWLLVWTPCVQARALTFEDRVAAQKAIEQADWNHRIWPKENPGPKPGLSAVMSDAAIRAKVEDYLKKSNALETWWQRPITAEQLQAELDRMSTHTRDAERLQQLFRALGNDPFVIAETLARPVLVDRLIRSWYSTDTRFHGVLRTEVEAALARCATLDCMKTIGGEYRETTWKLRTPGDAAAPSGASGVELLNADEWESRVGRLAERFGSSEAALPMGRVGSLEETSDAFVVTAVRAQREGELATATVVWQKQSFDSWWTKKRRGTSPELVLETAEFTLATPSSAGCINDTWANTVDEPTARSSHVAVWTGTEMIIWGGVQTGDRLAGGRYNPATDSWTPVPDNPSVSQNYQAKALWTGTEMLVWGGTTAGRYNPSTDGWTLSAPVPTPRNESTAVWTGTEMIIWGGMGPGYLNSGSRYNPSSNSWTATSTGANSPSARTRPVAVWTGAEMLVYGGSTNINNALYTGGRYDPSTDTWTAMTPAQPTLSTVPVGPPIWTGTEMIVWGYANAGTNTGGRYNPSTNSWAPTSTGANAPSGRTNQTVVWTGTELIVWGGSDFQNPLNTGSRYNPATDSWLPISTGANVPAGRLSHSAVWTGTEMIVWGGSSGATGDLSSGGRYNPLTNSWVPTRMKLGVPTRRTYNAAVWTGTEMIVWGGHSNGSSRNSGGRYNPSTDNWVPTSTGANVPPAAEGATAVWTGTEMIVWGGAVGATGGRYSPSTDTWLRTSEGPDNPSARSGHTAVWTGTEMIIWGGNQSDTGGRYSPSTNSWSATPVGQNVPLGRSYHTAVWAGQEKEMIVWGGNRAGFALDSGGRYSPSSNMWTTTSVGTGVPFGRYYHTAVWTGSEMIVWGGLNGQTLLNTGGRYNSSTDAWVATSIGVSVPVARELHTATWSGTEMIVWGGTTSAGYFNTGGRYSPTSDSWLATSTGANVPTARYGHTAVWTGSQMIVWGGGTVAGNPGVYCACPSGLIVYRDVDGDGYGSASISIPACDGSIPVGYVADGTDCDDANVGVHPGASETCNGLDDNCDGVVDNGASALCNDSDVCTDDACNGPSGCSHAFNASPCDDGVLCTNNDTCSGGSCAGVLGPPPEIRFVSVAGHVTTTLSWTGLGGGTTYDLATSTFADLPTVGTTGATCLANDVPATSYDDTQPNPAPSAGYYYLIRAQNVCGNGGYGFDSSNVERVPAAGCP